jgi:hypothetical protein
MADYGFLDLFDDEPSFAPARPHAPPADEAVALALGYEKAVLECLDAFRDQGNVRAQVEACIRFDDAMSAFMALPKSAYRRGQRAITRRGKITGMEWWQIRERMAMLTRQMS